MNCSRRDLLKYSAGLAALAALGFPRLAAAAGKKVPVGLQLYSLRKECAKDLPGMIAAVANIGFRGVEFAGYHNRTAKELRKLLDDAGLVCCGTHTGLDTLLGDAWAKTVEFNQTLGNKFLIVPSLPHARVATAQACRDTAKLFGELAAQGKACGMRVGYHAHGGDFKKIEGETIWDLFFGNTGPDVVMQLDTGNCLDGGGDPVAMLKKYPGRATTIHMKEHGGPKEAAIGEGVVPWAEVFNLCETSGGTEWYIVEHEVGNDPLKSLTDCYVFLKKCGKV